MENSGKKFSVVLLPVFLAAIIFSACNSGSSGGVGASCSTNDDCDSALVCNSLGQCITVECKTAADCNYGKTCSAEYKCVDPQTGDCETSDDCENYQYCNFISEKCELKQGFCEDIFDCNSGQNCVDHICTGNTDGDTDTDVTIDGDDDEIIIDGDTEEADSIDIDLENLKDTDNDGLPDLLEDKDQDGVWDENIETNFNDPDTDKDGIPDGVEDANLNGRWDLNETDPLRYDTDFDKLSDGEEDLNLNGVVDEGETDPRVGDTDNDGVIDGNELSGNYSNGNSSNPLSTDSDFDGIPDGVEDKNVDGIYQPEDGETDPTLVDSDNDGTPDGEESVASICQEDQVTVVDLHSNLDGDWTLALLPDITYSLLNLSPAAEQILYSAAIQDATNKIAGFILSREISGGTLSEQVSDDNSLVEDIPSDGVLNHRGRPYETADGFEAMTSHYTIKTASSQSVSALANQILGRFSGKDVGSISGLPTDLSASDTEFEVVFETLMRSDRVIVLLTVTTITAYEDSTTNNSRIRMLDLTDGTSVRENQKNTTNGCDPLRGTEPNLVDIIWVVDDSGSMNEDQAAVASAADVFANVMTDAGIDFRVGVTSTDCYERGVCNPIIQLYTPWLCPDTSLNGLLGNHGFTSNMTEFKQDVQDPPCGQSEYGLDAGATAIKLAMDSSQSDDRKFRQDASIIIVYLSDENDEECKNSSDDTDPVLEQEALDKYMPIYDSYEATCFAITGDNPDGCGAATTSSGEGAHQAGSAYIAMAYHTGGSFGSICSPDFTPTMEEMVRAAAGTASVYELEYRPITSTLKVMIEGVEIDRSASNGFEYDAVSNAIVFYGESRPSEGDDVVFSYKYFSQDAKP